MKTKQSSIENFIKTIDDLISSNYILSEKKLSDLMRMTTSSKVFYTLFSFCSEDFDYDAAFLEAFHKGDSYGAGTFVLPKDAKTQIALIYCLLIKIDTKGIDFLNLLERYFYTNNNYNDSFRSFSLQVLVPFRSEVLRAVTAMCEDSDGTSIPSAVIINERKAVISEEDIKTIIKLLDDSRSIILQYKIDPILKAELIDLYNYFKKVLYEGDAQTIRIAYLGYKYATIYHRKSDTTMWKIEKILRTCGILG